MLAVVGCGLGNGSDPIKIPNIIHLLPALLPLLADNFVYKVPSLICLSYRDITFNEIQLVVFSVIFLVMPFTFILISYSAILAVLRINSAIARKKTFGTCFSRLIVVTLLYIYGDH